MSATEEPTVSEQQAEKYAGVDYCVVHSGVRNEGDSGEHCDFAEDEGDECDFRPLFYRP